MQIENHRLVGVRFEVTDHMSGLMRPEYVVIHYTATQAAPGVIAAFKSKNYQASAHLVVDLDGSVVQMVPFNRIAWHAGQSRWAGRVGCNQFTIGIEVVNPGYLKPSASGYLDCCSRPYRGEVVKARHKNTALAFEHWAAYTPEQIDTVVEVCQCLFETYGLRDVVGHEDIAPGRKFDPGPAFPMDHLRARVSGRMDDGPPHFFTTTQLNVRQGPGVQFQTVPKSPLPRNAEVTLIDTSERWWHVMTQDGVVEGWVHSAYLHPTESRTDLTNGREHLDARKDDAEIQAGSRGGRPKPRGAEQVDETASSLVGRTVDAAASWLPPAPPDVGEPLVSALDPRVDRSHGIGVLPCPKNPPPPEGWEYWKGPVSAACTKLAQALLRDPNSYPMGTFVQDRLDGELIGARVEWHELQGKSGKRGCFRGVNLMRRVAGAHTPLLTPSKGKVARQKAIF